MDSDERFTDGRVPDTGIKKLFQDKHHWQCWLDVEAALAQAEAMEGIIPQEAANVIAEKADIAKLDTERIHNGIRETSHPLMALVNELSNAVGDPHGGWVHWGATTENITLTGNALLLRKVHFVVLSLLSHTFESMGALAEKGEHMLCAGRTHGQQAVPITFGFKVAGWIDEFDRHADRLKEIEPRVFTAMIGGAVGNFASLGEKGPAVQAKMAQLLKLEPMGVPSRAMSDSLAEYVFILGVIAASTSRITKEVYILMQPEFNEVCEPIPEGTVGSSTMPHKRNPQLADDCIAISAEIRSLVPLALEGMLHDHEVSGANTQMTYDAVKKASILTGDMLSRLNVILSGMTLNEDKMKQNLEITGGLIYSEAVMLALGEKIGRQHAHEIIYEAAQKAATGDQTFRELLLTDSRITEHLSEETLNHLLDPANKTGLSAQLSREAAHRAYERAKRLK